MQVRTLPIELKEIAEKELYETPNKLENGIQHLRDWILKQPHLRVMTDDQWLAAFLRGCKYRLEQAKEKMDIYYSLRTTAPEIFRLRHTDEQFKDLIQLGIGTILPTRSSAVAPRVVLVRGMLFDPSKYYISDLLGLMLKHQQILMIEDDAYTVAGTLGIFDLEGTYAAQFLQMTPNLLKKIAVILQDAMPLRLKTIHFINTPPIFEKIFNIGIKFLNEKHQKKIFVHSKTEELYKYLPKETLPVEYGGNGDTIPNIIDNTMKVFAKYEPWFEKDNLCGTDEALRLGEPKTAENMFGLQGSFRQLEFD